MSQYIFKSEIWKNLKLFESDSIMLHAILLLLSYDEFSWKTKEVIWLKRLDSLAMVYREIDLWVFN